MQKESISSNDLNLSIKPEERKQITRRWGRKHDQKAFKFLKKELSKIDMNIDWFLFKDSK